MDLLSFFEKCEEVIISNGVASFTHYQAERDEYHGERNWWTYTIDAVLPMVKENLERWEECEDDEERAELICELAEEYGLEYGNSPHVRYADGEGPVYYSLNGYTWEDPVSHMDFAKGVKDLIFIEVYPYRYGCYTGEIDMATESITTIDIDGDLDRLDVV